MTGLHERILSALDAMGGSAATPLCIARHLGDGSQWRAVKSCVIQMINEGVLTARVGPDTANDSLTNIRRAGA